MAVMSPQSKIICYHEELRSALLAALRVADKKLFGSIQFRPIPEDGVLQISALNKTSTFVALVPTVMCDVVDKRDEVFECLLSEASVMAKFPIKMPAGSDGEVAKAGLLVAKSWIQVTDETGLGIGIRHCRIRRNSEIELPGTPSRTIAEAINTPEDPGAVLYPAQTALVGRVAEIMGQIHQIKCIETSEDEVLSRVLLSGSTYDLTCTEGRRKDKHAEGSDGQVLSINDSTQSTGLVQKSLKVVGALPALGVS